jgi:hypothetical protein
MERRSRRIVRSSLAISLVFALAIVAPMRARGATIVIINNDGAGEGFNDPTPQGPVGGNPGTTRGALRLNVFNHAAAIWGSLLPSSVTIQVLAQFNSQTCNMTSGVLGSAGARTVHSDFPGAELPNMWYCQALANKLSGVDQSPTIEDINATFNSDVDNSTCLGATSWYYGFDGNDGTDIELLPVVLHELGHGLGFQTFANTSTGQLLNGTPDIFAHYLLDRSNGLHWDQMSNNQRKSSATNTGNLVWDGFAVNFRAPNLLQHVPEVAVVSPGSIAGTYVAAGAEFGPLPNVAGVNANVVLVIDGTPPTSDACEPIVNGAALAGNIALLDRGVCTFVAKVAAAQAAGAVGVIVANNVAGAPSGMAGTDPTITIPSVMISQADGTTIKNALLSGAVNATIRASSTKIAGWNPNGGVMLYSPSPLEPGSSVSHFDVSATPDLLMEPIINVGLHDDVDLTRELFEDIGWLPRLTAVPATTPVPPAALRVQSAPNPFHPSTVILLDLPAAGATRVEIYDLQGRMVKRLVNTWLPAGRHFVTWDGTDAQGRHAAAGVYFSRVAAAGLQTGQRLVKLND